MKRLVKLKEQVTEVLSKSSNERVRNLCLNVNEWYQITELTSFLDSISAANTILNGQKYVSISLMGEVIYRLKNKYFAAKTNDDSVVQEFKSLAFSKFSDMYSEDSITRILIVGHLLDPTGVKWPFLHIKNREERNLIRDLAKNETKLMAIKIWENINIQTTNNIRSSVSKKHKTLSQRLYDSDEEDYEEHEVAAALQNISEKANNEISNLMQECPEEEIDDSLKFWKKASTRYPMLSLLAKYVLSIPATSVLCERLFSATGQIITKNRAKLDPIHTKMLIFLKSNSDLA
jgi:hypothetical protein